MAPASLKRKLMGDSSSGGRKKRAAVKKKRPSQKKTTINSSSARMGMSTTRDRKPSVASLAQPQQITPSSVKTDPSDNEPLRPKIEYSPNAMAKCTKCRKKIQKQQKRFGIPEESERYNKEIYRYYHANCCPKNLQKLVPNAAEELKRQKTNAQYKQHVVQQRHDLLDQLKHMRLLIANRLEVPTFMVLSNATLDEIVFHMPTNAKTLRSIKGIGPTKLRNFGDPIFTLVQQYQYQQQQQQPQSTPRVKPERKLKPTRKKSVAKSSSVAKSPATAIVIEDSDDDDEIAVGTTLTCEQLVNQKFEHAAANGYVISVDD
ncbi:ATP-dependent DNA helicase [Seminavis robusta]|uniref:ATP-dependent DNA helicase n=1 Tax=Seminavis robusta TaxID=568900 RepID=A0A9N8E250_9STRA|nr:ATP-dependent DNA helicase [Seminavis robusta]|eukprot:Sro573_g168930.1 ATP-dependent DNA helicase (317) ;mRNA; r:6197-7147